MQEPLYLFARIAPKADHFAEARDAIRAIIPQTLAEPGCHEFVLHAGAGDGCLYLYEAFADEAALEAHGQKPYTREVFAKYRQWLAEPVRVTRMKRVS